MADGVKRVRTCVGCGVQSDKMQLMRIVRASDGSVSFDPTGRAQGRGAYVCSTKCFEKAYASRKLQRALRCGIEQNDAQDLAAKLAAALSAEER